MTREEAIYYLEKIKQEYDCSYEEDALDMAIQTLVIIDKIEPMFGDMLDIPTQELMRDATPEERESIDKYIKSISKPTGIEFDKEQEPKTGHWIYKTMEGQFCSICGEQSVWKFNYCPNCGAKMIER